MILTKKNSFKNSLPSCLSPLHPALNCENPSAAMIYVDDVASPSTCVARVGGNLYFGGKVTDSCLSYLQTKILTVEIHEKYGVFHCHFVEDAWRNALTALFPESFVQGKTLRLDLRHLCRDVHAPEIQDVHSNAKKYLPEILSVNRVSQGCSTFVYRIKTKAGTYYARYLPENASFAAEVTAHKHMTAAGVSVPPVIAFLHREEKSGLSMMLAGEIPGASMEEAYPKQNAADILREAGKHLALMHTIPVDGFGWIDRNSYDALKGEKSSFREYFEDYLADDLATLQYYDFTDAQRSQIQDYMAQAQKLLDVSQPVLVHGDFDATHIFHAAGKFTGFIDFGEIRGNNRLFDLGMFAYHDFTLNRSAYPHLIAGYREIAGLDDSDLYAAELMALFILLRFAGKKVETASRSHWERALKSQLHRLRNFT